jgi:hypothetical protein
LKLVNCISAQTLSCSVFLLASNTPEVEPLACSHKFKEEVAAVKSLVLSLDLALITSFTTNPAKATHTTAQVKDLLKRQLLDPN